MNSSSQPPEHPGPSGNDPTVEGGGGQLPPAPGHGGSRPSHTRIPEQIGPFRILQLLSDQGGMGDVYLAEQRGPITRRIALKIIKLGLSSTEILTRFEMERQALAILNHPGIARIFDAGVSEDGRPYFAMEYVAGVPITQYCDMNRLGVRDRLELFRQLCRAIHHAHQKGIIHRDIKPSNILVAVEEGKPVVKVIDFGVARALDQRLTEKTVFTRHGVIIGTPEYMSPEQAEMRGLDIDTTTDVYSLGVVLYELLVGVLPFDSRRLRAAGYAEMQRIIREEDPPRPTLRISTLGDRGPEIARQRGLEPASLRKELQGDLEWITLRAMEKDRTRRYLSVSELAGDISHYLLDEPVSAGPPTARYRMRKLVRRHRRIVGAVGTVFVALLLGFIATTIMYLKAERATTQARWESYKGNLSAAQAALQRDDASDAKQRLAACPEEFRRWEWKHLNLQSDGALMVIQASEKGVYSVSGSPEGARFATAGGDGAVRVWDMDSGKERLVLGGHEGGARIVRYSPDGTTLASGGEDRVVRLWDAHTGALRATLKGHTNAVVSLSFSPDGKTLVSSQRSMVVGPGRQISGSPLTIIWDTGSGLEEHRFTEIRDRVEFDRTGERLIGLSGMQPNQRVIIQPVEGASPPRELDLDPLRGAHDFGIGCDGAVLVPESVEGVIGVFDPVTGAKQATLNLALGKRVDLTLSLEKGSQFLVTDGSSAYLLWPKGGTSFTKRLLGHDGFITSAWIDEQSYRLLTSSNDGSVRIWDLGYLEGIRESEQVFPGSSIGFFDDGEKILTSSTLGSSPDPITEIRDRSALVLSRNSGLLVGMLPHPDRVPCVAVTSDGGTLITGCRDGKVRLWSASTLDSLSSFDAGAPVLFVGCLAGDREILVTTASGEIQDWSRDSAKLLRTFRIAGPLKLPNVEARDARIVLVQNSFRVNVLDLYSADSLWTTPGEDRVWQSELSPDGRRVAIADQTALTLRDARSGKILWRRGLKMKSVNDLAFSPEGDRLCVLWMGETFDVLVADTGERLLTEGNHFATSMVYSTDGSVIVGPGFLAALFETRPPAAGYPARREGWRIRDEASKAVERAMGAVPSIAEGLVRIRADRSVSDAAIRRAAALLQLNGPSMLNTKSWSVARRPGLARTAYEDAIRLAEGAVAAAPEKSFYRNTLGVALYRAGRYEAAIRQLLAADSLEAGTIWSSSVNQIPLAMAYQKLGRTKEARESLRAGEAMDRSAVLGPDAQDLETLLQEARALIR